MKTFKDNAGRTWTVSVDVDAIRRVRTALKVNLTSTDFGAVLEQILSDPVLLCDVPSSASQADQQVSDEDFGRAMAGTTPEHAQGRWRTRTPEPATGRGFMMISRRLAENRDVAEQARRDREGDGERGRFCWLWKLAGSRRRSGR